MNVFGLEDKLFDSHAHIAASELQDDIEEVVLAATSPSVNLRRVAAVIDVAIDLPTSMQVIRNAKDYPVIKAAVGIDPQVLIPGNEDFDQRFLDINFQQDQVEQLSTLVAQNRGHVAAVGEVGMDDHYYQIQTKSGNLSTSQRKSFLKAQENLFRLHLELAKQFSLPLTIHTRGFEAESLKIIQEYPDVRGVFHSFTGDYEVAKGVLDLGWGLGVNGIITYKNAQELRDMYKKILGDISSDWGPDDFYARGVYFETDSPYLAPSPLRGSPNSPANVDVIFSFLRSIN